MGPINTENLVQEIEPGKTKMIDCAPKHHEKTA